MRYKDLTNQKFGKLTAIRIATQEEIDNYKKFNGSHKVWVCNCDCGKKDLLYISSSLTCGKVTSCGCNVTKHGMWGTRLYSVWHSMKQRCYCKTDSNYKSYGAKGIKTCDEWKEFIPFMNWALENGYNENAKRGECTLDRIDPYKNYSPENCRWVDMDVQSNNRKNSVILTYNGVTDTLTNLARLNEVDPSIASHRYHKGLALNEVFSKDKLTNYKRHKIVQKDLLGNTKEHWKSLNSIIKTLKCNGDKILECCNGRLESYLDSIWEFE